MFEHMYSFTFGIMLLAATASVQAAPSDVDDLVGGLLHDETGVEGYYNFAITPWLNLSADAQWIDPGIAHTDEELILGLRLNARF